MAEDDAPKIHIDSDWKAEAQREKQRAAEQAKSQPTGGSAGAAGGRARGQLPEPSFEAIVNNLAMPALMSMGAMADPRSGQPTVNLDAAKFYIDLLGVLEDKTKDQLSDEEQTLVSQTAYELRQRYIALASQATS